MLLLLLIPLFIFGLTHHKPVRKKRFYVYYTLSKNGKLTQHKVQL